MSNRICVKGGLRYTVPDRPQLVDSKRRDVGVVDRARLEIALTICDGVLQISIIVADPES